MKTDGRQRVTTYRGDRNGAAARRAPSIDTEWSSCSSFPLFCLPNDIHFLSIAFPSWLACAVLETGSSSIYRLITCRIAFGSRYRQMTEYKRAGYDYLFFIFRFSTWAARTPLSPTSTGSSPTPGSSTSAVTQQRHCAPTQKTRSAIPIRSLHRREIEREGRLRISVNGRLTEESNQIKNKDRKREREGERT